MPSPTSRYFEEAARKWDEAGRPAVYKPDREHVMKLYCWSGTAGAKHDGISERLAAYVDAMRAELSQRNPDWYDDLLNDRKYCFECGTSWHLENVSVCTLCSSRFFPCHWPETKALANGNSQCPDCGNGEIVG
jgi:hypothetical protein